MRNLFMRPTLCRYGCACPAPSRASALLTGAIWLKAGPQVKHRLDIVFEIGRADKPAVLGLVTGLVSPYISRHYKAKVSTLSILWKRGI